MTDREIASLKVHFLIDQFSDHTLVNHADLAGALIYAPTKRPLTARQIRRNPPAELVKYLTRTCAAELEELSVAIVGGRTVVRKRINPEDLRRRAPRTLNFPEPK